MKLLKIATITTMIVMIFGCSNAPLKPVEEISDTEISVIDNRTPEDKKTYRSSLSSPLIVLGDDIFEVSPTLYLKRDLYKLKPQEMGKITLEIEEFKISDFFPVRLNTVTQAGLTGSLSSLGITYYGSSNVAGKDSILCSLKGKLNGEPIESSSQIPYKIPFFAFSVRGSQGWLDAVTTAINECAKGAYN